MKTLREQIKSRTRKNIKRSTRKNTCDMIHELLYNKEPMERDELVGEILYLRLKDKYPDLKNIEDLKDSDKIIDSLEVTSKNGLDTALAKGKGSSSYYSNKKYQDYQLIKDGSLISIVDKKK